MKYVAIILSCCVGFLSLSQEILWVRLISFTYQSVPQSFAFVLCYFLIGIALGAEVGKRVCTKGLDLVQASAWLLTLGACVDFMIPGIYGWACTNGANPLIAELLIISSALFKSALFPIVHHLGSMGTRRGLGVSVSTVYFANIVGSTLGPLVTGFVLLDRFGVQQAFTLICAGDLLLATFCFALVRNWAFMAATAITLPLTLFVSTPTSTLMQQVIKASPKRIIENRHGIIHVLAGGKGGDVVFGGNAYDGCINTSLNTNSNMIHRVYALAALHPNPKRVLVIGMSSGAWTQVISAFQGVERIDVVEINSGYLELLKDYPEVSDILKNPKIHIAIDDGRRWLKRNPQEKYDLIVMNTTWHWRSYASNLLSVEFIRLIQSHMNPGAILAYNSTWSMDAFKTAAAVFPHAYLYANFIFAGDWDFRNGLKNGLERIVAMQLDHQPLFNRNDPSDLKAIHSVLDVPFQTFSAIQKNGRPFEIITEQNMITEYKYGKGMF